jgi:hypothetical protein
MANIDDILTTAKNIVTAINGLSNTYGAVQGNKQAAGLAATTTVSTKAGRLANVIVTTAGSTTGTIKDNLNVVFVVPTAVGAYPVNIPINYGIVFTPGTSQVVTISYS